jgi:hypothetical protein
VVLVENTERMRIRAVNGTLSTPAASTIISLS